MPAESSWQQYTVFLSSPTLGYYFLVRAARSQAESFEGCGLAIVCSIIFSYQVVFSETE